jgi:tripartite ATP-independent transporter DctM subunit
MTALVFVGSLFGSMAFGMPIAFALIVSGIILMLHMGNFDAQIVAQNMVNGSDSFVLLAVPFFILAGNLMDAGGVSKRIVGFASAMVGHKRGGLGYVCVFAGVILASVSGSAIADTAALCTMLLPLMVKYGYNKERSAGLIGASGIIGPIIPPSLPFIVFGVTANLSITKLFIAGIVPGLMMGTALIVTWWIVTRYDKSMPVAGEKKTAREIWIAFREAVWALMLPVIIVGGLKFGIFTPSETGAVVAFLSLFIGLFIYKELKLSMLYDVFLRTAKTTAVVLFLVAAALVASWLITVADVGGDIGRALEPLLSRPLLLMLCINVVLLFVGMVMDLVPSVLILTPIFMPLIKQAGIDPIYFGLIFILNLTIGLITPPVGTVLNVVCGAGHMTMTNLIKGIWPFIIANAIVLILLILFPSLVLVPLKWML